MADFELFSEEPEDTEPYSAVPPTDKEVFTTPSDPDIETLVKRIANRNLVLRPKFQRAGVWDSKRKSKLIESLILNLPIPPCFFAEDDDDVRVVVDGQQRLIAIDDFYNGRYALEGLQVLSNLNGATWDSLPKNLDRRILQRVIRTLVISKHTPQDIRFEIFERLNTGGEPLTDQEIRNATLSGGFNDLLDEIASTPMLLRMLRRDAPDSRLRHHELVLRYFALSDELLRYEPPFKHFLTSYMKKMRRASESDLRELNSKYFAALECCYVAFADQSFRKAKEYRVDSAAYEGVLNRAVYDVQMLGFTGLNAMDIIEHVDDIREAFEELIFTDEFFSECLSRATDHRLRLRYRVQAWFEKLGEIGINPPLADELE